MKTIDEFLMRVRSRLNRGLALRTLVGAVAVAVVAALVAALVFRVRGYAVPPQAYLIPLGVGLLLWFAVWFVYRRSIEESARRADTHFGLKDGLLSALHFRRERREGEVYDLQRQQTEERIKNADPGTISYRLPTRTLLATVVGVAAVAWMATLPASEAVQKKQAAEEELYERTAEIAEEYREFVEEILEEMTPEEREVVDPEELKKLLKDLQATKDERDAMRQFAKIEMALSKAMKGLETRADEEVLKLAAAELGRAEIGDLRNLAKLLDNKEFKKAEMKLQKMNAENKEFKDRELKKEDFEKMREAMKRMAAGAKRGRFAKGNGKGNGKQRHMQDMLGDLDEAAEDLEDALEDMEMADDDLEEMEGEFDDELGKLGGRLGKLDAKAKMRGRLKKMRKGLGQCQGFAAGSSRQLGLGKGGLKPGVGSVESRREQREELTDNGNTDRLKGQKGRGPSEKTVEEADSGTGVAGRSGTAKAREYRKTFESFVHRDDVPEEVKAGVREYFEQIHEHGESVSPDTPETP